MRVCLDCGAINNDDDISCKKCGTPLLWGLNLFQTLVKIRRSTVKKDDFMIKQSLLHMGSAYLTEPANLGVQAPSSEGKTFPIVETSRFFPSEDVWYLAGLSPTALAHDYGVLVDLETREPLAPKLMEIEDELDSLSPRKREHRQKIRELRRQRAELLAKSAYLVDLENKILLFLDKPNPETLQYLYPVLSHDTFESIHKFTDRKGKGPLKSINVILRGWPVAIFCRTQGEKNADNWAQTISRFTTISPRMNPEKYRAAIQLKAVMRGLPGSVAVKKLQLDREEWAKEAIAKVKEELSRIKRKVREETGMPKASMFWIPYYKVIGREFPADIGRRMRDSDRFLALLQAHAAINVFARPRLVFSNGTEYIICTREDYEEITTLFFSEEDKLTILTGLSRNVIEFFRNVVLPLWREQEDITLDGKPKGLAVSDLVTGCLERLKKSLSDDTIRKHYLRPLSNAGFISFEEDPEDRRRKLVRVLREDIEETGKNTLLAKALNFSLEELKKAWNELISITAENPPPKIIDYDGRELTLEELYNKYYLEQESSAVIEKSENQAGFHKECGEKSGEKENPSFAGFSPLINLDLSRIKSVERLKTPRALLGWCDNCCQDHSRKVLLTHRALTFNDNVLVLCDNCADLIIKALRRRDQV